MLGLRSLFLVASKYLSRLRYLHFGLAAVLSFAAIKLVCGDALGPHPLVSVLVIASCIALAAGASFVSDHT